MLDPSKHVKVAMCLQTQVSNATALTHTSHNNAAKHIEVGIQLTLNQTHFQAYPEGANYVQTLVGSRNSAIHNAYHILLHSLSSIELRHSLQKHISHVI